MAQGSVDAVEEGAGRRQSLQKGQEEDTIFPSISDVKRTTTWRNQAGADIDSVGIMEAGAGVREETVRPASERGNCDVLSPSPLKQDAVLTCPSGRRSPFHDEVPNDVADGEHNWDTIPSEPTSPALRGVHRIAVEVMRRSFGSADGNPALLAFHREIMEGDRSESEDDDDDDDDGMWREEQSLSTKAAYLHQSLTDVSVDDIDVREALEHAAGATDQNSEGGRRGLPAAAAAAAAATAAAMGAGAEGAEGWNRPRGRSSSWGRGGGQGGWKDADADAGGAEEDVDGDSGGGLVIRPMARRPLREMLRLEEEQVDGEEEEDEEEDEGEEEEIESVARLEHLPPFTERWALEALTSHVLSQVFSGLVPVASSQGLAEPVCTYMLECCVRPDVEAATVLHVASQIAANHGLELVRKRGGQVLFGVAPPNSNSDSNNRSRRNSSDTQQDRQQDQTQEQPWSPRASGIVLPPSPVSPPAAAAAGAGAGAGTPPSPAAAASGASAATSPTPSSSDGEVGAAAAATGGARWGWGKGGGGGGAAASPAASSSKARAENTGEKERGAASVGEPTELRGWWGAGGAGWGSWSHVDMQLVVGQASKHRLLLIRFVTSRAATCRDVYRLAAAAAENGQPLAIAPAAQGFVSSVRGALRDRGTLLESLQECPPQKSKIDIDPQFLGQVEGMCQFDMVASLREAGVSLDEHARNEELRGVVVTRLLEEMFELVGLPMLPPPPQLVLAMPRPNDILPSSVEPMPDLTQEDEAELASHRFSSEAGRVTANVLARCVRYTEKCDEQMTARMQRKNRQVMQRISRSQMYQRELFQALRDGHMAVRRARMTTAFTRVMQNRPEVGIDPNVEAPVYFCSIVCNRRPGILYLTYWHICAVTRVPGFSAAVSVMGLQEVDAVEIVKVFVGHGIQVRKSKRGETDSSPSSPSLGPVPPSSASSVSPPPAPRRSNSQADAAAAAAAAVAVSARKARPASITFATTKVATAELRELIVALVRVHREPVTSPTTAERAAAASKASPGL